MREWTRTAAAALVASALAMPAWAAGLSVSGPWFRTLPEGLPSAGYFEIHNSTSSPVVLTGARSSACGMLMLHQSTEKGGTSRMRDVASVTVPANGTFVFAPGGYHLMCMNPSADMSPGKSVEVTLVLAGGRTVEAPFSVRTATGK
ncbi:MAG: copper chaperone PCu(A)C [Rhizomicrobium sp.]